MALSNDLAMQFARVTNTKPKTQSESTVYGTAVSYDGAMYVRVDGSDLLTPVESTVSMQPGERVTVLIKNHSAIVTGNITDPSAGSILVGNLGTKVDGVVGQVAEFQSVVAGEITVDELLAIQATIGNLKAVTAEIGSLEAINAAIENLEAKYANLEYVDAGTIKALNADIENLEAMFADIEDLDVSQLEAVNAYIGQLKGYNAEFTYLSAEQLKAVKAEIKELDVDKLDAKDADIKYANIDFANIGEAAIEKLFSESGIIRDLIMSEGHVTGKLVGVTIVGDLIEGGTVKADKLVVLGEDGLYYKLNVNGETVSSEQTEYNSLHGSIITAKSVTAEKVRVDDLVAFDATIGGFKITDKSIYSGVKKSVSNTTRGIYLDKEGQITFGDADNYLRYYKDQNGDYKLELIADSIILGNTRKSIEETLNDIEVGVINLIRNSKDMVFDDYYFEDIDDSEFSYLVDELDNMLLDENDDYVIE